MDDEVWCGCVCVCVVVGVGVCIYEQTRIDGVNKVKSMLRTGFDKTRYFDQNNRGTIQTRMTKRDLGMCVCGCGCGCRCGRLRVDKD